MYPGVGWLVGCLALWPGHFRHRALIESMKNRSLGPVQLAVSDTRNPESRAAPRSVREEDSEPASQSVSQSVSHISVVSQETDTLVLIVYRYLVKAACIRL